MLTLLLIRIILANALPSLRIFSPLNRAWLVAMGILAIVLFHTAVTSLFTVYIQSIGSGMDIFSELFNETSINQLLVSSLPLIKPRRLTKKQQEAFSLPSELKEIFVGLLLGDLLGRFRYGKARFVFKQGLVHEAYLLHLYELFKDYCPQTTKTQISLPHKKTGNIYKTILFYTYSLPCFS